MENNEIDRFDTKNGRLIRRNTKIKGQINKEYLLKSLDNYFKDSPEIDINDVGLFILDNRPVKENSTLIIKQK